MVELSDKFSEMPSLQNVVINGGPLVRLPLGMQTLTQVRMLDVGFNRLKTFDVDISKWEYLILFNLNFNKIQSYHSSLWLHPFVVNLHLNSNVGFGMPLDPKEIYLPKVRYLHMGNNSSPLPSELRAKQFPVCEEE